MASGGLVTIIGTMLMAVFVLAIWLIVYKIVEVSGGLIKMRKPSDMKIMFYVEEPIPIRAVQLTDGNKEDVLEWCREGVIWSADIIDGNLIIGTFEGNYLVNVGDYIVEGVHGEIYPVKRNVFEESYDRVSD